jgi:hypothetical protein
MSCTCLAFKNLSQLGAGGMPRGNKAESHCRSRVDPAGWIVPAITIATNDKEVAIDLA